MKARMLYFATWAVAAAVAIVQTLGMSDGGTI